MYFIVTGPYRCLICSKTEYLDIYKYVEPMTQQFDDYVKEASPLMEKMTSIIELCKKKCMGSEQRRATLLNIQLVNERLVLEKDKLMLEI